MPGYLQGNWDVQQVFGGELLEGERIEWFGQPDPSVHFCAVDLFLVPFSLLWGGFAIFWEAMVLGLVFKSADGGKPPLFFALFGLPFVVMGLYFMFGRFIYKAWRKTRTFYAVTNRRVLSLSGSARHELQAEYLDSISQISKSVRANGIGTITFGQQSPLTAYTNTGMDIFGWQRVSAPLAFHDVRKANEVYELVNRLKNTGH